MFEGIIKGIITGLAIANLLYGAIYLNAKVIDVFQNGFEHTGIICAGTQDYINEAHNEYHD